MKNKTLLKSVSLAALIIGVYISTCVISPIYDNIFFLPLSLSLFYLILLFAIGNRRTNIGTILIIGLTFFRYCVLPLLMTLSGFSTSFFLASNIYGSKAIYLMIYEALFITLALIFANNYRIKCKENIVFVENTHRLHSIISLCILFCVISYIAFPSISGMFRSIFQIGEEEFTTSGYMELRSGSLERAIRTLFTMVFNVTRIVAPLFFIRYIIKKGYNKIVKVVILFIIVLLQFMFLTSTFAEGIVSVLVILICVAKLQPNFGKTLLIWTPILTLGLIILYFSVRYYVGGGLYNQSSPISYAADVSGAYFTGINNVCGALNMPREGSFKYLYNSILTTIPFNTTLFGAREVYVQTLFNTVNGTQGQIPPTIGNGYFYFGFLLSPVCSFMLSYLSVITSRIADTTRSMWRYIAYIFIAIVFALGISMYNEIIAFSWVNAWGLPLLLFAHAVDRGRYSIT